MEVWRCRQAHLEGRNCLRVIATQTEIQVPDTVFWYLDTAMPETRLQSYLSQYISLGQLNLFKLIFFSSITERTLADFWVSPMLCPLGDYF